MQGGDESEGVPRLHHVLQPSLQLPVHVVDEAQDAWPPAMAMNRHTHTHSQTSRQQKQSHAHKPVTQQGGSSKHAVQTDKREHCGSCKSTTSQREKETARGPAQ